MKDYITDSEAAVATLMSVSLESKQRASPAISCALTAALLIRNNSGDKQTLNTGVHLSPCMTQWDVVLLLMDDERQTIISLLSDCHVSKKALGSFNPEIQCL